MGIVAGPLETKQDRAVVVPNGAGTHADLHPGSLDKLRCLVLLTRHHAAAMRRPRREAADHEEKRVTHGCDMNKEQPFERRTQDERASGSERLMLSTPRNDELEQNAKKNSLTL